MFKDDYKAAFSKVTASPDTYRRVMHMAKRKRNHRSTGFLSKALIAAVIVSMLAITASASESIENWFTQFFGGPEKLNQEQVQFLEDNTQKLPTAPSGGDGSAVHTDVLQFVKEEVIFRADANNTHVTGEGETDYQNFKMYNLTLSETKARLIYRYFDGMDWTKPCSISHLTVVLKSGEEIEMPITVSKRAMDFEAESPIPLEEVEHIRLPDGVEVKPVNQVEDGYDISVDSVLTDGQTVYVTLNITTPEEIKSPGPGWTLENNLHFCDGWICPVDQEKPTMEEIVLWGSGVKVMEDGDGKDNTYKLMLRMTRDGTEPLLSMGTQWKLHIEGIEAVWHNRANEDALFNGKYAGQDVLLDGEEAAMTIQYETLCWDTWDFHLNLDSKERSGEVELVTSPVTLSGYRQAMLDELRENPDNDRIGPFEIQLVSLRISPLSYYLEYTAEDDYNAQTVDVGEYTLVMKDGREIGLTQYTGRHNFQEPILLSEADHVLLPNGTKLPMPE